ncbi:MAG: toll/interleukin-1 receptor domain-containing protein [Xanthobacteraceae bacterium]
MMEFDAFISYSSRDKTAADAACAVLESAGIRCWIAPRDIRAGGEYGAAIIEAIDRCQVMVLIFSSSANDSQQISREIERAVSKGIPIVPVRIEEVVPTKSMEYFLGAIHWLDALTPPIEKHLQRLAETVKAILQVDATAHAASADLTADGNTAFNVIGGGERVAKRAQLDRTPADAGYAKKRRRPSWLLPALAIGVCIVLLMGGVWYYQTHMPIPVPATGPASPSPQPGPRQAAVLVPETVPFIPDGQRVAIRSEYLPAPDHKALAVSFSRSGFITGQPDDETAKTAALDSCKRATQAAGTKNPCQLYAVGNTVVFPGGNPPLPPAPWLIRNPAIERPFASKDLPLIPDSSREFWETTYPKAGKPKALGLSPAGQAFYYQKSAVDEEAIRRTLEACGYLAGVACMIIAVDDSFVVPIPVTMKVTGFFHVSSNPMISSEAQDALARRFGNATNAWNGVAVGANGSPGLILNAANEQDAIEGALADCSRQDRNCRVIALGPFSVEPANLSK